MKTWMIVLCLPLVAQGGSIWVSWTNSLQLIDENGTILQQIDHMGTITELEASGDGGVWLAEQSSYDVCKYGQDGHREAYFSPGPSISGLASDRGDVWVSHTGTDDVIRYDLQGQVVDRFLRGQHITDLTVAGGLIWVADAGVNEVVGLTYTGELVRTINTGQGVSDIEIEDGILWTLRAGTRTRNATGYDLITGSPTRNIDIPLASDFAVGGGVVYILPAEGDGIWKYSSLDGALLGQIPNPEGGGRIALPEPATLLLLALGGVAGMRRRREIHRLGSRTETRR